MSLTVGRISYVNTIPFFHHLVQTGFSECAADGVPAELNARLAAGSIDLSPSSSFEYARNWRDYLLLPGLSISSRGPVRSVLLFSRLPLDAVAREEIALTAESATSVNLLQVLLKEFCDAKEMICSVPGVPVEEIVAAGGSALLIGDRALRTAGSVPRGMMTYDLGELWYRFTGLPFVFALWIVRRRAFDEYPQAIRKFSSQLQQSLSLAFADLAGMAAAVAPGAPLTAAELVSYWRDSMSYDLTAEHLAGLRLFYSLCCKHGLLMEEPEIRFAE
ncbi:MAG: menaquinone biosynthesis protein [Desulfuromonadales bacterium]|nr:menaquinone biosynthesis protein [Desulfuromonadales bacterium]